MWVIIEHNGSYIMGLCLDEFGEVIQFNTEDEAQSWANENCAFNYKIVGL